MENDLMQPLVAKEHSSEEMSNKKGELKYCEVKNELHVCLCPSVLKKLLKKRYIIRNFVINVRS